MSELKRSPLESRVLVLFPTNRDLRICEAILAQAGLEYAPCADLRQVCREFGSGGASVIVLTEEGLATAESGIFLEVLRHQPRWSDIPLLVLSQESWPSPELLPLLDQIDNLVLLTRPIQADAFLTAVRSAIRARNHQYRMRQYLTERKRVEQELRETGERFRALVTASNEIMYRMSPDWSEMRQLQGSGFVQDTPQSNRNWLLEYIPPEDLPLVNAKIQEAIRTKSIFQLEHRVRRTDGSIGWTFSRAVPLLDEQGEIYEWFGAGSDVTERKQAEEALQQVQKELSDRATHQERLIRERTGELHKTIEELEHFSYSITHDMRAPLRTIRSFISLLIKDSHCSFPPKTQTYLTQISQAAERMDHLIVDALDYSKSLSAHMPMTCLDADSLLRGILGSYPAFQPPAADIQIEGRIPELRANHAGLTQCISNLLNNAVKFVAPGRIPQVRIYAETLGPHVRLWFADNGIGIAKESQERIFNMFHRESKEYHGTGIGLALVRKVAERMGGKAGVESELGKGSRFWLELEAAPPPDHGDEKCSLLPLGGTSR